YRWAPGSLVPSSHEVVIGSHRIERQEAHPVLTATRAAGPISRVKSRNLRTVAIAWNSPVPGKWESMWISWKTIGGATAPTMGFETFTARWVTASKRSSRYAARER